MRPGVVEGVEVRAVPATRAALGELGDKVVANVVMLGAVVADTGVIDMEVLKRCLRETSPAKRLEANLKALELGARLVA